MKDRITKKEILSKDFISKSPIQKSIFMLIISELIFVFDISYTVFITATLFNRWIRLSFLFYTDIINFSLFLVTSVIFWLNFTLLFYLPIILFNHFGPLKLHLYHILQITRLWTPHRLQLDILIVLLVCEFRQLMLDFVRVLQLAFQFNQFRQGCSRLWGRGYRVGWGYLWHFGDRSGFFEGLRF